MGGVRWTTPALGYEDILFRGLAACAADPDVVTRIPAVLEQAGLKAQPQLTPSLSSILHSGRRILAWRTCC